MKIYLIPAICGITCLGIGLYILISGVKLWHDKILLDGYLLFAGWILTSLGICMLRGAIYKEETGE